MTTAATTPLDAHKTAQNEALRPAPIIIPVTHEREAQGANWAIRGYFDETIETASAKYKARFGIDPPVIYQMGRRMWIPITREVYEGGEKLPLCEKG